MLRFLILLVLYVITSVVGTRISNETYLSNLTICETPICHDIAEDFRNDMNTSVDPCDDFFQYTCGKWHDRYKAGDDHMRKFERPTEIVNRRIKEMLEFNYGSKYPPVMKEAVTFYNQCRHFNASKASVAKQIFDYVKREKLPKIGGWPLISPNWNESEFNLEGALIYLHNEYWINALYDTDVLFSESDGRKGKMQLSVHNPFSDFGRLVNSSDIEAVLFQLLIINSVVEDNVKEIVKNFHTDDEDFELTTQMTEDVEELIGFAVRLSKLALTGDSTDLQEHYTLAQIQNMSTNINWLNFFTKVFGNESINETQRIYVSGNALKRLDRLIATTSTRTLANFVGWRFLDKYNDRVKKCVESTKEAFPHAIGALYAKRYLDERMFNDTLEYIQEVRSVFDQLLNTATWMDESTRQRAKQKLQKIKVHVGYPEIYKDDQKLKDFHKGLTIQNGSDLKTFLKNVDTTFKFHSSYVKENWADKKVEYLYQEGAVATNAAYFALENSIAVFVGILIEPFYHPHRPLAMNYGSLGYIIGHELTHAFDKEGRDYDEDGNKRNWWSERSAKEYEKRYQCYLAHYAKVAENMPNATEYSKYTASENIADGGGLHEAYAALKSLMKRSEAANARLPGAMSKYTPEQLFFLSFANSYCAYFPSSIASLLKYTDVHSMDTNRIIGTVMNSRGFSEAFNCPIGSPMNPANKCSLFE